MDDEAEYRKMAAEVFDQEVRKPLDAFLAANSQTEALQVIAQFPELRHQFFAALLNTEIIQARQRGDATRTHLLEQRRELLRFATHAHAYTETMNQTPDTRFIHYLVRCNVCGGGFELDLRRHGDGIIHAGLRAFSTDQRSPIDPTIFADANRQRDVIVEGLRRQGNVVVYGETTAGGTPSQWRPGQAAAPSSNRHWIIIVAVALAVLAVCIVMCVLASLFQASTPATVGQNMQPDGTSRWRCLTSSGCER